MIYTYTYIRERYNKGKYRHFLSMFDNMTVSLYFSLYSLIRKTPIVEPTLKRECPQVFQCLMTQSSLASVDRPSSNLYKKWNVYRHHITSPFTNYIIPSPYRTCLGFEYAETWRLQFKSLVRTTVVSPMT